MGGQISANYSEPIHKFDLGIWKIYSAKHLISGDKVSLWQLNYPLMKQKERNKKNRRNYLKFIHSALIRQRPFKHANILQIREVSDPSKEMCFSSEPVKWVLEKETSLSKDEIVMVFTQLAGVMNFIHKNANMAFLGCYPGNIVFSPSFTPKLALFLYAVTAHDENHALQQPFLPYRDSIFHVPSAYCAPETLNGRLDSQLTDIYMYAATVAFMFLGSPPNLLNKQQPTSFLFSDTDLAHIPQAYQGLLTHCLSYTPSERMKFSEMIDSEIFSSVVSQVFLYLPLIDAKSEKDIYIFFNGLGSILHVFSDRILKKTLLKLFVTYTKKDARFGIALFPSIFKISERMTSDEFIKKVLNPLDSVFRSATTPELAKVVLDSLSIIENKIPKERYKEYIIPPLLSALASQQYDLSMKAVSRIEFIIEELTSQEILKSVLPHLTDHLIHVTDHRMAAALLDAAAQCAKKASSSSICFLVTPAINTIWNTHHWIFLAQPILSFYDSLQVEPELLLHHAIPILSKILSVPSVARAVQRQMLHFIMKTLVESEKQRGFVVEPLSDLSEDEVVQEAPSDDEDEGPVDPFAPQRHKAAYIRKEPKPKAINSPPKPVQKPQEIIPGPVTVELPPVATIQQPVEVPSSAQPASFNFGFDDFISNPAQPQKPTISATKSSPAFDFDDIFGGAPVVQPKSTYSSTNADVDFIGFDFGNSPTVPQASKTNENLNVDLQNYPNGGSAQFGKIDEFEFE